MSKKTDGGVSAPVSLLGLFNAGSEEEEICFEQIFEMQQISIGTETLSIQQMAWHPTNANKVWPGTFSLATFVHQNMEKYMDGKILEIGSATGALAIYLSKDFDVTTSDFDDGGEIEANIKHNFISNGINILSQNSL